MVPGVALFLIHEAQTATLEVLVLLGALAKKQCRLRLAVLQIRVRVKMEAQCLLQRG
jgi:hypothetical protein